MNIVTAQSINDRLQESRNLLDYSNCQIKDKLFLFANGNKTINFSNSIFEEYVKINSDDYLSLNISNANFKAGIEINFPRGNVNASNSIINHSLIVLSKDSGSLNFKDATVNGVINISESVFTTANFEGLKIEDSSNLNLLIFKKNIIKENLSFKGASIRTATFNETSISGIANFDNCILSNSHFTNTNFGSNAYFNKTIFGGVALFNGAVFSGSAIYVSANEDNECIGDFSGAMFYKRVFFDMAKFKSITFKNCEFADVVSFKDIICDDLEISKAVFLKGADFLNASIKNADKETFRIIKNEFLKINNQIESLKYKAKEMYSYERELTFRKNPNEYSLLVLNRISNNYGLSWLQGLKFTISIAIVFYLMYLISLSALPFNWGWKGWHSYFEATGNSIKYFIRFLIITHDIDFMEAYKPSALSFIIDFISKIFISYGIYQTIQGFRKYGK